ncbi:MAG: PepSY-associated TM helix domain-containing protein [Nitrospirales bacterium]
MHRQSWRMVWLSVHRALALSVGVVFVLMGLTGSCNVFYIEIEEWLHPKLAITPTQPSIQSLDDILSAVQQAHPHQTGSWHLEMPHHPEQALTAWHYEPQEKEGAFFAALMVSVNPYTTEILWSRFWGDTLMTWIYDFHWTLFLGTFGHNLVGILGLVLLLSLGTGLYLWWPTWGKAQQAFTIKRGASESRLRYDCHRVTGIYSVIFLAIAGISGFYLVYPNYVNPLTNILSQSSENTHGFRSTLLPNTIPISLTQAVSIAHEQFPTATLRWVTTPKDEKGVYEIQSRQHGEANITYPATRILIDQYSGNVLSTRNPSQFSLRETFLNIQYPLHNGEMFGLAGRIIIFCLGIVPLILYVTGITMWLRRGTGKAASPLSLLQR